jgi:hypothetical protein
VNEKCESGRSIIIASRNNPDVPGNAPFAAAFTQAATGGNPVAITGAGFRVREKLLNNILLPIRRFARCAPPGAGG